MNTTINDDDLDPCLDEQELRAYASGEDTGVRDRSIVRSHLNVCEACRERLANTTGPPDSLESLFKKSVRIFRDKQEEIRQATKKGPVHGTIWRAKPNPDEKDELIGPLVLVLDSEDNADEQSLYVVEVSEEIDQAIDSDILILPEGSGLSLPAIIRTENAFRTGREWLHSFAVELPDSLWHRVGALVTERQHGQHERPLRTETDSRLEFLQASMRKCQYLSVDEKATVREQESSWPDQSRPVSHSSANMTLQYFARWLTDLTKKEASYEQSMLTFLVNPPQFQAKVVTRGTIAADTSRRYSVGEELYFALKASTDGYLVIFHHVEGGEPELVFPNRFQRDNSIVGGRRAPWPPIRWGVGGPPGKQYFMAIWTSIQLLDPSQLDLEAENVLQTNMKQIQAFRDSLAELSQNDREELVWEFEVMK